MMSVHRKAEDALSSKEERIDLKCIRCKNETWTVL